MIRHGSSWTRHFDYRFARIGSDLLVGVVKKIGGADERLGQVVRIVDDHHHGQMVAVPEQMFGSGGVLAARDPIAADPAFLEMRGGDGQHVAVPFAGRESLPGVGGVGGRMRTAIHPNGSLRRLPGNVGVIGDQLLGVAVHFLPDAQVGGAAPGVIGRMRAALILGQRQQRRVPAIAAQARRVVDRQPEIVADIRARECAPENPRGTGAPIRRKDPSGRSLERWPESPSAKATWHFASHTPRVDSDAITRVWAMACGNRTRMNRIMTRLRARETDNEPFTQ